VLPTNGFRVTRLKETSSDLRAVTDHVADYCDYLADLSDNVPGATDLKSLIHSRQNRLQGFQIESGTRIVDLLVSFDSEVRKRERRKMVRTSESGH
jgi:hypothetical protein